MTVRKIDKEKLVFFTPNDRKYCFNAMHFGPTNAPPFCTAMMKDLKDEWDTLFFVQVSELKTLKDNAVTLIATNIIIIGTTILVSGSNTVRYDILLWCDDKDLILIYLSCVCKSFKKYCVSFRLDKCVFLKFRVE